MWIKRAYRELKEWQAIYRATKRDAVQQDLEKSGLKVDWIGRAYTVVNVPPEFTNNEHTVQSYVLSKLRDLNSITLNLGISDVVYPEVKQIKGTTQYLIVLGPKFEDLTFSRILYHIIGWILCYLLIDWQWDNIFRVIGQIRNLIGW